MQSILLVLRDLGHANTLIDKCAAFSPERLNVVVFEENDKDLSAKLKQITASLQKLEAHTELVTARLESIAERADHVCMLAERVSADLVVTDRPRFQQGKVDTSMEQKLLACLGETKLLICGSKKWRKTKTILATVDIFDKSKAQDKLNDKVLSVSAKFGERLNAELHAMAVIPLSRVSEELDWVDEFEVLTKKGEVVRKQLAEYVLQHLPEAKAIPHVTAGVPNSKIPDRAKQLKSDITVIGNVGRTGIKGLIIGNTAEKILYHLSTDVLIAKCL
ncbi:MAG: universal stress protein [Aestuariibacter sp.]